MKFPERDGILIAILSFVFLAIRLPLSLILPLIRDEALYAVMIEEQKSAITLVPTFLGHFVSWKPPLFFWIYLPFSYLPLPLELSYRLPSMILGLLSLFIVFRLMKNLGISSRLSFFSILFSLFSVHTIYPHATLLTDSLAFFFISLSLYLYTEKKLPEQRFLAAGLFAFSAFFVKLVIAFMIPVLAVVYFLINDRKTATRPIFLLSLLAVPLAFAAHYALLESYNLAEELYHSDVGGHLISSTGALGQFELLQTTVWALLVTGGMIWLALALFGFKSYWKENPFMSAWFCFSAIPLISSAFLLWYYLPVMPAISYFAVKCLAVWKGREKYDAIFHVVFSFLSLALLAFAGLVFFILYDSFYMEREAGLLLSGKENVLVAGQYTPSVISYKVLPEMRGGKHIDFGWIVLPENTSSDVLMEFINNYRAPRPNVTDGSFSSFFTSNNIFRKDTGISEFDYIVVSKYNDTLPGGHDLIYNRSSVLIYKVS
jgi:4-amino-4-deoxy-L-arabinose transferase-like glycosyltransferase